MSKPTSFKYSAFSKKKPKSVPLPPSFKTHIEFLDAHYVAYPKMAKGDNNFEKRVNCIRQMTVGVKKMRDGIKTMLDSLDSKKKDHQKFKSVLMDYIELLRQSERDRQKWIKAEQKRVKELRDHADKHESTLQQLLENQGLDDVIRI